jgi:hypothetical protein
MLYDLLLTSKYLSQLYDRATMESSDSKVRDTFKTLQQDEHELAQMLYGRMQQQGWYNKGAGRTSLGTRINKPRRSADNFDSPADSRYAVTSGASNNFGRRLASDGREYVHHHDSGTRYNRMGKR